MSVGKNGRELRRFPRYDVAVPVILRKKNGDIPLLTGNVSRHGAFVRTSEAMPLRQLVQLRFRLPGMGDVDAMCMVARRMGPEHPSGAGVGVDFFALSKEAKTLWERFVAELRARAAFGGDEASGPLPAVQGVPLQGVQGGPLQAGPLQAGPLQGVPLPPVVTGVPVPAVASAAIAPTVVAPSAAQRSGAPEWLEPSPQKGSDAIAVDITDPSFEIETIIPAEAAPSSTPPRPADDHGRIESVVPRGSVLMHRVPSREALRAFIDNEVQRGGMFLKTALLKEVGDKVDIALVHPETDEEFHLEGTVVRRVVSGPVEQRGLGIFFRALSPEGEKQLDEFVDSGIEVIELGSVVSERQLELEAAVAREPDNAEALEALGTYLLDEEGDLGGALTALTRALVLGPSVVSIHASLARAYRRIGDSVKVRAHERVAEALMMMQDRMRISLGVGDDDAPLP